MQRGQAVGYEEGYKKGKEDSPQDHDIEAAHTAAFKEGLRASKANLRPTAEVGIQSCTPQWYHLPPNISSIPLSMSTRKHLLPWTHRLWFCQFHVSMGRGCNLASHCTPTPHSFCSRQHAPRDFSGLRSSGLNPFGSLQRRSKQLRGRTPHFRHQIPLLFDLYSLIVPHLSFSLHQSTPPLLISQHSIGPRSSSPQPQSGLRH